MWHKLLIAAAFVASIDQGNAQSCTAKNGKKCIFPFFHNGRRFTGCTKFTVGSDDPAWCSTKTTKSGQHIKGNFGDCPSSCPTDRPDKYENLRRTFVKESCKVRGGITGVCRPANECLSVSNPKKGSCSSSSHVCCYYEKPSGSSDRQVNSALSKQSRLRESKRVTGYSSNLAGFNLPKYKAAQIDLAATKIQIAAEEVNNELGFSSRSSSIGYQPLKHYSSKNNKEIERECPWFFDPETKRKVFYECTEEDRPIYRPIDGSCNFLSAPHLGKSFTPFQRIIEADYGPNRSLRKNTRGRELPSARLLSTKLAKTTDQADGTSAFMTVFVMQMGQFIDHDLAHSPNHMLQCCPGKRDEGDENCIPIDIPANDPFFDTRCMEMARAMTSPDINCEMESNKQQMNQLTHWLDASNIYGSEEREIELLRQKRDGLLRTSSQKNMLPKCNEPQNSELNAELANEGEGEEEGGLETCHAGCPPPGTDPGVCGNFAAGDFRVNEHHGLVSMHTLWMREHNRVARELKKAHRTWDDDKLFEEARRVTIAEYQHIIYNEWLTIVLGNKFMDNLGLKVLSSGYSNAYFAEGATPEQFDPRVSNEFATAAFRFGHSLIPANFQQFNPSTRKKNSEFPLRKRFNQPGDFREDGVFREQGDRDLLSEMLFGLASQKGEKWDNIFAEDIVNHLFEMDLRGTEGENIANRRKNETTGMDLIAINIQRGRDHGIPSYNALRETCKLGKAKKFSDFGKEMIPENWKKLEKYYDHPDDVDLFAGGFLEQSGSGGGGILGPVFRCIIGDTFARLRYGDRYFYDLDQDAHLFRIGELNEIRKTSLARILCDNVPEINRIQPRAFVLPGNTNKVVSCNNIPKVDISSFRGV